jgi:hypothetical protein
VCVSTSLLASVSVSFLLTQVLVRMCFVSLPDHRMTPAETGKCVRHHSTVDTHCVKGRLYLIILNFMYGDGIRCTDSLLAIPPGPSPSAI